MGDLFGLTPLPPPVIECRQVSKWYGAFQALDQIDLTIREGEVLALVGPSGAGKSTLLRCINGIETHTTGDLDVLGVRFGSDRYRLGLVRRRIGMVFQDFNLFPQMSVQNNVIVAQRLVQHRPPADARRRALEALDDVDMAGHARKHPHELSGGEQQRVAIARMLVMDPEIVLLDEPTASIDPELTKGIVELMKNIASRGVTVVAVTHEIGFAREVANRMLYLESGRIVEDAHPEDLLHHPRTNSARRFLNALPRVIKDGAVDVSPWAPPIS